jgi:membrane protease YdiL (CAAX protease family)
MAVEVTHPMDQGTASFLVEFSNTLVALAAAGIYCLWTHNNPAGRALFPQQRWTASQAVLFFFVLDLVYKAASPLLTVRVGGLPDLAAWLLFHSVGPVWVWLFFRYVGQPVRSAGLSFIHAGPGMLSALRWLFGMVCLVAVAGMAAPPGTVAAAFYMDIDLSEGLYAAAILYGVKLLVAASLAGLIEEVGYRGILYGLLRTRINPMAAMALTAVGFMLAHGEINPLAFGMGLLCAWMVERYHSLLPAIILHSGWDLASGINAWFLGAMKQDPESFFHTVALLTGAGWLVVWLIGKTWNPTRPVTMDPG